MLSIIFMALLYIGTLVLVIGLAVKIRQYAMTPAPLKIPTTPAPTTTTGVVFRMFREVAFFESLFKASKWTWAFGWIFHGALLLVLLRHFRYFTEPVWDWIVLLQPFGKYAGYAMVIGLAGLWIRRIAVDRIRYISSLSDHLMLALIIAIGLSGLLMNNVAHTDIIQLKAFALGLVTFNLQPIPSDPLLLIHLLLVVTLMVIFPFSKLLHAPGVFFSPTRNQADNPREKRYVPKRASRKSVSVSGK